MPTARFIATAIAATFVSSTLFAQILATGDPRSVTEPVYPVVCAVVAAQFSSSQRSAPPSPDDTQRLEDTLSSCAGTGQSVIVRPTTSCDAFYSGAVTVNGEALVVAAGVTPSATTMELAR
jgi:polygalacturonase